MRIGIDVGGTNTDAVVIDGGEVVAWAKCPTTADVEGGVEAALDDLIANARTDLAAVTAIVIGTTHFTNALAQARGLNPTAAIRIGREPQELPPMVDWPKRVHDAVGGAVFSCGGGHEFDGRAIQELDEQRLRHIAAEIRAGGLASIAVTSTFSPVNPEHELRAHEILAHSLPGAAITLSHQLGTIGILERENATIINACLRGLARTAVTGFERAIARSGLRAPMYISQNDGTLMSAAFALDHPVAAIASGPTNSMRGAAYLSGLRDCAVVDLGGTTSDAGILSNGFPRAASTALELGGVRTNFRMPDVLSVPLGGGSVVRRDGDAITVGPDSIGFELTSRARVFGGDVLTATDIAVAAGFAGGIGDRALVDDLDPQLVAAALRVIERKAADAVDRLKTTRGAISVVVVGGGSVLVGERLAGLDVVRPALAGVANAIGAAIAQIGGEVDRVFSVQASSREQIFAQAKAEAVERAIAAGARRGTVELVELEDVPLSHLPDGTALRVRARAIGELDERRDRDALVG